MACALSQTTSGPLLAFALSHCPPPVRRVCSDMPSSLLATHEFKLLPSGLLALTLSALSCVSLCWMFIFFKRLRVELTQRDAWKGFGLVGLSKHFLLLLLFHKCFLHCVLASQ